MTLQEFKAWFEGFSEIMDGPPDAKQWDRIKARVSEIDSKPISYPVYIDRYVTPYRRYYDSGPWWGTTCSGASGGGMSIGQAFTNAVSDKTIDHSPPFDVLDELKRAGRAEFKAMSS